jgi:CHAD domain-containing protein
MNGRQNQGAIATAQTAQEIGRLKHREKPQATTLDQDSSLARFLIDTLQARSEQLESLVAAAEAGTVDGIHQLRRSTRALRATLRLFGPWIRRTWRIAIVEELRWLTALLGGVRDLDVMSQRLQARQATSGTVYRPLLERVNADRETKALAVRSALDGNRFETMLRSLKSLGGDNACRATAWQVPTRALNDQLRKLWKRVRSSKKSHHGEPQADPMHNMRKRGKDLRLAIEIVLPLLTTAEQTSLDRFYNHLRKALDLLGTRQDSIVTCRYLAELSKSHSQHDQTRKALRRWLGQLKKSATECEHAFRKRWSKLKRVQSSLIHI